jgi:hypothetical protein
MRDIIHHVMHLDGMGRAREERGDEGGALQLAACHAPRHPQRGQRRARQLAPPPFELQSRCRVQRVEPPLELLPLGRCRHVPSPAHRCGPHPHRRRCRRRCRRCLRRCRRRCLRRCRRLLPPRRHRLCVSVTALRWCRTAAAATAGAATAAHGMHGSTSRKLQLQPARHAEGARPHTTPRRTARRPRRRRRRRRHHRCRGLRCRRLSDGGDHIWHCRLDEECCQPQPQRQLRPAPGRRHRCRRRCSFRRRRRFRRLATAGLPASTIVASGVAAARDGGTVAVVRARSAGAQQAQAQRGVARTQQPLA